MNIELANRLLQYRKNSGLSQEELAEKLNISRQSVSKWERAEASPDTDNLIELAKIYNVTLDELLNVNKEINKESNETKNKKVEVDEDTEIFENDKVTVGILEMCKNKLEDTIAKLGDKSNSEETE